MTRMPLIVAGVAVAGFGLAATMLGGWFLLAAGANGSGQCVAAEGRLSSAEIPTELKPLFRAAAAAYTLGEDGPAILAGLTKVESDFGRNRQTSTAGAVGWTQFMPATWQVYGVDADGDGRRDPEDAADAIFSTANYLRHLGAPSDWRGALFGYNHADWYVREVLDAARRFRRADDPSALPDGAPSACSAVGIAHAVGAARRVHGGGRIVPIPGEPGETIDERILPDLLALRARYRFRVTAGFAPTGHAAGGEHPLGLAVDLVPGPGSSWDDIDALAHWAEPTQDHPRAPFRWVGYDGDAGHGRGNHLHLSWVHAPAPDRRPPAQWVEVISPGAP